MALNDEDRTPVLVGVGQRTQRDVEPHEALDPIGLMLEATRSAAEDARLTADALAGLDRVIVPAVLGGRYGNPAALLAERLGAPGAHAETLGTGGNGPQKAINDSARAIARGEAGFVLLAGAEALDTRQRAHAAGISLDWSGGGAAIAPPPEPAPSSALELGHRLLAPPLVYPLYENALRAHHGRSLEAHRAAVGELLSGFSEVAAANPHAWFRTRRSADEITRPGPSNRMVSFPYTKYMNAMLRVDQSAAVLLTSAGRARSLGVPADRFVHWLGGGDAIEAPWTVTERPDFHSSNGMERAFADAFREARLAPEDVHGFDLYSCFPAAVELACDTLGIALDDPRPLTATGGLPYAGGPGNDYVTHGIASLVPHLRAEPGSVGMVTGLGWYFTKHSAGLYSTLPRMELPPGPEPPPAALPKAVEIAAQPAGPGTIETYTVLHDRAGDPELGIVVGRLADGRRFVAHLDADAAALAEFEAREGVGRTGTVRSDGDHNRFTLAG